METEFAKMATWELWVVAAIGLGLMLAGYRVKRVAFFVIWFIIGYTLMGYLLPIINSAMPDIANNELWQWLLPLAAGLLVALLGFSIEKFCLGGICFGLVIMITAQYFGTEMQTILVGAVIGVIVAGAAVMLIKPAIIIATAVAGAYLMTVSLLFLFPDISETIYYWPMLLGASVIGSVFQFLTTKRMS